jgi:hypothetical protein
VADTTETLTYTQEKVSDAVSLVRRSVEDCERIYHDRFLRKVEKRYLAYRGLTQKAEPQRVEETDMAVQNAEDAWRSEITTPYVLQTCEGMLATMLEPNPSFDVKPRPQPDEPIDEVVARLSAVTAVDDTLRYALDRDQFATKQRDFMQQDLIAGISVLKTSWKTERRTVTRLGATSIVVSDSQGVPYASVPSHQEVQVEDAIVWDDACCEVVDVRDFFWPAQASRIDKAEYLIHRTWESFDSLKRKEKDGEYQNVDQLKTAASSTSQASVATTADLTKREMRTRNQDRTRNLIEVLEYWTPERVITVGNRTVLLADRPNPLWNGRLPFVVCAAMPDAFQVAGLSVVEALAQLQEMLWTLQNQRLDVVRMLANLITVIRSDVDDPESFEWAPNAQWFVEDPGQVDTLKIDPTVASITLQAEELLKGDLQNIMGGLPYGSGVNSSPIDQETATGVSIITTIAQRIIQARKQHYLWAYAKVGKQFLQLYQQYLRDDRVVRIVGAQGAQAYKTISPLDIQGDYDITIDATSDSLLRQERRSEAQALLQIAVQSQPMFAQSGAPLNLRAFMEKTLDAFDVLDKETYFLHPAAPPVAAPGQNVGPPGLPGQPGAPGQQGPPGLPLGAPVTGVTNPGAAAGPMSPSSSPSMSPVAPMQRMGAMSGGPANNGGGGAPRG